MTTIRRVVASERTAVANTLASAFDRDPLTRWTMGADAGESIEPRLRILFGALTRLELGRDDHLMFTSDDFGGAAVWKRPNAWKGSTVDMLRTAPAMVRSLRTKTPRMIGSLNAIEKVHPTQEHYYLEVLGISQEMQGKGIGSAMIRPMLDRCDSEGMPAYLESSNPQNIAFYVRHGFVATGEIVVGKGAPTVTAMWRDPR